LIRTVVVASSLPSRAGLKAILNDDAQIDVVAEAVRLSDLAAFTAPVDVLLVLADQEDSIHWDLELLKVDPPPAVLLLSSNAQQAEELIELPLRAWGILPADFSQPELLSAIYAVDAGLITGASELIRHYVVISNSKINSGPDIPVSLTAREMEVLHLLADGLANKQISMELEISEHTVKFHVSSIYQKLNVSNRAEAVRIGIQHGLIMI
jgi:DNA-binding NarL/FixJ family response regulator